MVIWYYGWGDVHGYCRARRLMRTVWVIYHAWRLTCMHCVMHMVSIRVYDEWHELYRQ